MTELKIKALDKLNEELSKPHSSALDKIHNWLSDQEDDVLFTNIVKEGKSLSSALAYVASKVVRSQAQNGVYVMDDESVFSMIVEYYESDKKDLKSFVKVETLKQPTEITEKPKMQPLSEKTVIQHKNVKKPTFDNMSIFDFGLDDQPAELEPTEDIVEDDEEDSQDD